MLKGRRPSIGPGMSSFLRTSSTAGQSFDTIHFENWFTLKDRGVCEREGHPPHFNSLSYFKQTDSLHQDGIYSYRHEMN